MLIRARRAAASAMLIRCGAMSLVEMLMTLSVTAIVLAIGMPSLANWMHAAEVRNSASDLIAALQGARTEALARNQEVRITLGDAQGNAVWSLGCTSVTANCPRSLRSFAAPSGSLARWGASANVSANATASALSAPLRAGQGMPAQITFNAVGAAPAVVSGSEISRIDVSTVSDSSVRRLVILLTANGMVKLCDPMIAAGEVMSCH